MQQDDAQSVTESLPDSVNESVGLLGGLMDTTALDPGRRIFVNRNLRFGNIKWVGFDMDYTLAPYVKKNIEALSFELTAKRMVEVLGYPREILDMRYDPSFVVRGLVVDKRLGNIFKMDGHHHVGRVYHGRRQLTKDERRASYRNVKIRLSAPRYHWLDTLFSLPEAALYAGIIDLYERKKGIAKVAYKKLFNDIRTSIDTCHRDGSLKTILKADLPKYIVADPQLPHTLHKLRSSGKRLFVLTNSYYNYTNAVMSYMLNGRLEEYPNWINYFDLVIVGAEKPTFFTENKPFYQIDPETEEAASEPAKKLDQRGIYQGGSHQKLEKMVPGCQGEQVLYVGDHIYGDIIRSKKDSLWRTALILEELEQELLLSRQLAARRQELEGLDEQRSLLDHEVTALKMKLSGLEKDDKSSEAFSSQEEHRRMCGHLRDMLDRKRRQLKDVNMHRDRLEDEVERGYNPYWGSVFKESTEVSRFGNQVEEYSCIYTSRVSNFLNYSPTQYFRSPRHWMPHEK